MLSQGESWRLLLLFKKKEDVDAKAVPKLKPSDLCSVASEQGLYTPLLSPKRAGSGRPRRRSDVTVDRRNPASGVSAVGGGSQQLSGPWGLLQRPVLSANSELVLRKPP
ncbi:hypothetical protein MLD38_031013 [Melastoma candidum]|uniref:Uncharacterized protein n=1 Tax=Melastoma candidum TaxID=119954 RepID=A0ACB9MPN0_9MYRT|nr:hypothetical protein MLD38_031013 [Melastoma candidum]